jgi:hypothetical protein
MGSDPSVIHFDDFSSLPSRANGWLSDPIASGDVAIVDASDDPELHYEPLQAGIKALKLNILQGQSGAYANQWLFWGNLGSEPEEIYVRYYWRFADNWEPGPDNGKLPGIDGTYNSGSELLKARYIKPDAPPYAGNGGRMSLGTNGWSLRGGFDPTPASGLSPIADALLRGYQYYAYVTDWHITDETAYGTMRYWDRGSRGLLKKNEWHCIEHYVKVNSIDTTGATQVYVGNTAWSDAYTDGVRFYASPNSALRGTDTQILAVSQLFYGNHSGLLYPSVDWPTNGGRWLTADDDPTDTAVLTSQGVGREDGVLRTYIDGRLVFEDTAFRMRHLPNIQIFGFWLTMQHGGTGPIAKTVTAYMADLAIARAYVGPMRTR